MNKKSTLLFSLITLSLGICVYLLFTQPFNQKNSLSQTETTEYDFNNHIAPQRAQQEQKRLHQHAHNQVVHALTSEQVEDINNFVGSERQISEEILPNGGEKIDLNGKYRHAVVLKRNENGKIEKVEIGPQGLPSHE